MRDNPFALANLSSVCSSSGPAAPVALIEPTSSWSNNATTFVALGFGVLTNAEIAAQHEAWLSRRPLAKSESSTPMI